jgi:hypothetical protein
MLGWRGSTLCTKQLLKKIEMLEALYYFYP